jgi:hypothetical protein
MSSLPVPVSPSEAKLALGSPGLIRAADRNTARYVGNRPGTQIRWQVTRHLWFQEDYGILYAGRFLEGDATGTQPELLGSLGWLGAVRCVQRMCY